MCAPPDGGREGVTSDGKKQTEKKQGRTTAAARNGDREPVAARNVAAAQAQAAACALNTMTAERREGCRS